MSFSLSQIQRKTVNKKITNTNNIKQCYYLINSLDIVSDNVKFALKKYLDYRFKLRHTNNLNASNLKEMIVELLQECCQKSYIHIGLKDTTLNEIEIIYQIKKAIYYGATKHIYSPYADNNTSIDCSNYRKDILPPKRLSNVQELQMDNVKNYFKELELI